MLGDALAIGLEALDANSRKRVARVGEEARRMEDVRGHDRLEDVQLEVALRAREPDRRVVAEHLRRRPSSAPRTGSGSPCPA